LLLRWYTLAASFLLPLSGYVIGYAFSWLCQQRPREARTIAIETGIQNGGASGCAPY
jgi:BASS family bile acid:Na+ symporter